MRRRPLHRWHRARLLVVGRCSWHRSPALPCKPSWQLSRHPPAFIPPPLNNTTVCINPPCPRRPSHQSLSYDQRSSKYIARFVSPHVHRSLLHQNRLTLCQPKSSAAPGLDQHCDPSPSPPTAIPVRGQSCIVCCKQQRSSSSRNSTDSITILPLTLPNIQPKMSNLTIDTDVERKRQFLLRQLAELDAIHPVATISTAPQRHHRSPIQKHHRRDIPRSMSSSGTSMARHPSSDRFDNMQRHRNLSQRSAPGVSMARLNSKGTSSSRSGNLPFTNNGNVPPPLFESRREQPDVDSWVEQPFNAYTFNHQQAQHRAMSQRSPNLEQVPEQLGNVLEDPADFLNRHGALTVSITPSPTSIPIDLMNNHRHSIGSHNQFAIQTPATPAESLTTATTLATDMSRQNSLCNEPFLQSVEMMKFDSNNSYLTENMLDENQVAPSYASYSSRHSSKEDQSQIIFGAGASHDSQFSHSFSTDESLSQFPDCFVEKMERSLSNESTSSTSSSASRNKARLQAQNQHAAKRQLAPKGGSDESAMSRESSTQSHTQSKDGSQDKVAISKPSYVRPRHDRVQCHQCDDHPDGFRGEHELRRHQDRVHKPMVKKWVCIEPTGQGHPKPILPLARCKTCTHAKKKYGAYYNAAAHLRRAHFKPKAKGRSKTSKAEKESEKRGGKAGGDWPPMSELKHWMMEVDEPATDYCQQQHDEDESEEDSVNDVHSNNISAGNFDFLSDPSLVNVYPSPNTQLYDMQDVHLDPSQQQQQSIDLSMQYQSSSQTSGFDSFPQTLLSNDASAPFMFDNSSFLDQAVGLDFVQLNSSNFSYQ